MSNFPREKRGKMVNHSESELGSSANDRAKWGAQMRAPTHCTSDYMKIAEVILNVNCVG